MNEMNERREEMPTISTHYMGIELRNPVIAGSSGLTSSVGGVKSLEDAGAGAVVLKSIFEEEILHEMQATFKIKDLSGYQLEQYDLYNYEIRRDNLNQYSKLIDVEEPEGAQRSRHARIRRRSRNLVRSAG
jgi:dihydroorotate dehydrogenase (fumarate)